MGLQLNWRVWLRFRRLIELKFMCLEWMKSPPMFIASLLQVVVISIAATSYFKFYYYEFTPLVNRGFGVLGSEM